MIDRRSEICEHCRVAMTTDDMTEVDGKKYHHHHTPIKVAEGIQRRKIATAQIEKNILTIWPNRYQTLIH